MILSIVNPQVIPSTQTNFFVCLDHKHFIKWRIQNDRESTTGFWGLSSLLQFFSPVMWFLLFVCCEIRAVITFITKFPAILSSLIFMEVTHQAPLKGCIFQGLMRCTKVISLVHSSPNLAKFSLIKYSAQVAEQWLIFLSKLSVCYPLPQLFVVLNPGMTC